MWESTGRLILRYRIALLFILLASTGFMAWHASKVELSYEFSRAIPVDNPKYKEYQSFKKQFGEDGNLLVIGMKADNLFTVPVLNDYGKLNVTLGKIESVEDVLSVTTAVNLVKSDSSEKLIATPVFPAGTLNQQTIDSFEANFRNLPFYKGLLYNPATNTYLTAIRINKDVLSSANRTVVVNNIIDASESFSKKIILKCTIAAYH